MESTVARWYHDSTYNKEKAVISAEHLTVQTRLEAVNYFQHCELQSISEFPSAVAKAILETNSKAVRVWSRSNYSDRVTIYDNI